MAKDTNKKTAVIIGAGPAGLTAAYELQEKTGIKPVIFELSSDIGGISKTVNYKGNRIDIGGHRFFSKSDRVMRWWQKVMPMQGSPSSDDLLLDRHVPVSEDAGAPDPQKADRVLLVRGRLSRILFLRKLFDYPISLNLNTFFNLGVVRNIKIGLSYVYIRLFPIKEEKSLEDFFINRFGSELYNTFFKDYTEKVWGVPCTKIKPEWGAQRIKGLSIGKAIAHAITSIFKKDTSISQKNMETSLIGQFLYPKLGPGQMWELVADDIVAKGGEIHKRHIATGIELDGEDVSAIKVKDLDSGETKRVEADWFFSTMAVKDLIEAMGDGVPENVREVGRGLIYRDFITVGLLAKKLKVKNTSEEKTVNDIVPDNWIYVQERDVKLGRIQIFNNWSPYMVKDPANVWIGLEYFCNEGDSLWSMSDKEFIKFAEEELEKIDFIEGKDILDAVVIRVPKTYPAYFGTYDRFDEIREYVDRFENLFLIGRNGMHRYNNQDHSMLAAMTAVENIVSGRTDKANLWDVNTEDEYHETKSEKDG